MARSGVCYLLGYRSDKLDMVNRIFQYVRLTIIKKDAIGWIYSYLGSKYAEYYYADNIHDFINGNMKITVKKNTRAVIYKMSRTTLIVNDGYVYMLNLPIDLIFWYDDISKHFHELLPMNFADPISCYWKIVNFAKKHKLAI